MSNKPTMKRVETGYYLEKATKIYRLYNCRVTFPDGKIKDFPSEEHAKAHLEGREPDFKPFITD